MWETVEVDDKVWSGCPHHKLARSFLRGIVRQSPLPNNDWFCLRSNQFDINFSTLWVSQNPKENYPPNPVIPGPDLITRIMSAANQNIRVISRGRRKSLMSRLPIPSRARDGEGGHVSYLFPAYSAWPVKCFFCLFNWAELEWAERTGVKEAKTP